MKRWTSVICLVFLAVVAISLRFIYQSDESVKCSAEHTQINKNAPSEEHTPVFLTCEARFFDRHNGLVTAIATFVIALFTLMLGVVTAFLWDAGERQLEFTRKSSERQLRAYVHFMGFFSTGVQTLTLGEQDRVHITPKWKNAGCTPVRHMTIWRSHCFDTPPNDLDSLVGGVSENMAVGPNTEFSGDDIVLTMDEFDRIAASLTKFFVWGWADYNDVFSSVRRRTEFCVQVTITATNEVGVNRRAMITSRAFGPHNGTDHDCYRKAKPYSEQKL